MECFRKKMAAPKKIIADRGTENGHVAAMQTLLVGPNSFLYGRSTANQRIESWWGVLIETAMWSVLDELLRNIERPCFFSGDS